jgi:hypothetical protein
MDDVALEAWASAIANYRGIPVGTYVPDSELAPSRATSKEILRHRRLVFFTFDELGNPKWEPRGINYLGEPMSEICPEVNLTSRNCRQNRHTELFIEFKDLKDEAFERAAFKYLAKKHRLNEEWNWPTYDIMRAEPYRRTLRQVQANRLEHGEYSVPTFKHNGVDDVQGRDAFMERLEGIRDWEMENQFRITTRCDANSLEYTQGRFLLASRSVDLIQNLLHDTQIACASDLRDITFPSPSPRKPGNTEESPHSMNSPFTTPNVPFSAPVGNQQPVSTPAPDPLRRAFGMDTSANDHAHPLPQPSEATQANQDFERRILNYHAGSLVGGMSWITQPSTGSQMTAAPYHPGPNSGGQTAITLRHLAQQGAGIPGGSKNIFMPDAPINPQDIEHRSHVSSIVIPIDEHQQIRINVSREGKSPLDSMYPEPNL